MLRKLTLLLAAVGLGMLLAPKSGKEIRKDLSKKATDVKAKLEKETKDVR